MAGRQVVGANSDAARYKALRIKGGAYVRSLREAKGLTQRDLADKVGLKYYTFVSQVETGSARVPPESYGRWADALEICRKEFAMQLLRFYDPYTYACLVDAEVEGV